MLDESKRQRAMRQEVRISRQAMSVVQPINERIDFWQRRAARLLALGHRNRVHGTNDESLIIEAEQLLAAVMKEMLGLHEQMLELPEAVAHNGRLLDTQKALASVAAELERARALLDAGNPASRADGDLVLEPQHLEVGHQGVDLDLPVAAGR